MNPAIRVNGLVKTYPARPPVEAVRGLDLDVHTGECFGLLGPNGAGKTTTLEIIEGLLDATAGERERGSLEVLLTSPVPREQLIYGKIIASASYMLISLILTVIMFSVAMSFVGLEQLGITANLGPHAAATLVGCCAPLILFGSAYLTIISAFAKTYREAQTYLQLVITIPTMPLIFAGLLGLQAKTGLMFVPFLSQHLLMTTVVRAEPILPLHLLISVGSTLFYGVILTFVAGRLYRREALLG